MVCSFHLRNYACSLCKSLLFVAYVCHRHVSRAQFRPTEVCHLKQLGLASNSEDISFEQQQFSLLLTGNKVVILALCSFIYV